MNPQDPGQQRDEREFQSRMIAHCQRLVSGPKVALTGDVLRFDPGACSVST